MMMDRATEYDASGLIERPDALRERADRDGFLFFRGLIPRDEILALRRQVLELVREEGLLAEGSELMDGVTDVAVAGEKAGYGVSCGTRTLYGAVQRMPLFHAMAQHPKVLSVYRALFGEAVLVHPRNIMRLMFPGKNVAPTAPHQDHIYIGGTTETWTSWIPIGDCPMEVGNLAVLKGSHTAGQLPDRAGVGAGGREAVLDGVDGEWVHFNYMAGDVLIFPSLTVHKSIPTQHPERIRLSLDYRYQPASHAVHASSLEPHMGVLNWDEIYREWPDRSLQYYWKSMDLKVN